MLNPYSNPAAAQDSSKDGKGMGRIIIVAEPSSLVVTMPISIPHIYKPEVRL